MPALNGPGCRCAGCAGALFWAVEGQQARLWQPISRLWPLGIVRAR